MRYSNRMFLALAGLLVFGGAAYTGIASAAPISATESNKTGLYDVSVERVSDGDTAIFVVEKGSSMGTRLRARFAGIDAPEISHGPDDPGQPLGLEAKAFSVKHLFSPGATIKLRTVEPDRYGRIVSLIYVNGKCLNVELVRAGMAYAYRGYLDTLPAQERKDILEAEDEARGRGSGVWSIKDAERPWDYRKRVKH